VCVCERVRELESEWEGEYEYECVRDWVREYECV